MHETKRVSVARATIVLTGLTLCCGVATQVTRQHAPSPPSSPFAPGEPSSAAEAPAPIVSTEVEAPIVSAEVVAPIDPTEVPEPVLSPEGRALVDSLVNSAAAARPISVGLFSAEGCCDEPKPLASILEAIPSCKWELVTPADIQGDRLDRFDVLIFPGGRGHRQAAALGDEGRRAVQDFVRAGGGFVGICAGGFLATAQYDWSLGFVNTRTLHGDREIPGVGKRSMADRGPGTVKIELTEAGRAVFGDVRGPIDVAFAGGPIYPGPMCDDLLPSVALAYYRTGLMNYEPQRGTMINTPSILAAKFGAGLVVAISPHPETTQGLEFLVRRSVLATARIPDSHALTPGRSGHEPKRSDRSDRSDRSLR